jgi:hypothetical protein
VIDDNATSTRHHGDTRGGATTVSAAAVRDVARSLRSVDVVVLSVPDGPGDTDALASVLLPRADPDLAEHP